MDARDRANTDTIGRNYHQKDAHPLHNKAMKEEAQLSSEYDMGLNQH
jgi:hypothetical protein